MTPLPASFVESLGRVLPEAEVAQLCDALNGTPTTAVRINPHKCTVPPEARRVPWSAYGYMFDERPDFTHDPAFHAGCYYVQEPASQFMDALLRGAHVEGGRLLDMCAAPGGKSTIYATALAGKGLVVANEYVRSRANVLADNVRKWGTGNVVVTNNDARHFATFEGWFDVVAVDAPCSGEGMFRKDEAARSEWSEDNVNLSASRQRAILAAAWQALADGGVLIYSTCTFNDRENEGVLREFVAEHEAQLAECDTPEVDSSWGVVCGSVGAFSTFRFFPHRTDAEGLFVAVARKREGGGGYRTPKARRHIMREVSRAERAELARWVQQPQDMRFAQAGDTIYGYAAEHYDDVQQLADTMTVIYSGVAMGQIFKGQLKPDWSLSQYVALRDDVVPRCEVDRARALDYLRRQAISTEGMAEGLNLVLCDGHVLGFVKRVGARCNNLYPNSLKILK